MRQQGGIVVVVTGASRGLGREIALAFGKAGHRVLVNYREQEQLANKVVREIEVSGGSACTFRADVRNTQDADAMIEKALEIWGRVDVLVNNAGMTRDGLCIRMPESDWYDVINTNLSGPFRCIRAVAKCMMKQQSGHIVNIASISGMQGREGQANYSAAKAGLIGITRATAKELGRFNIRVNAVLPGYLPTDMSGEVSDAVHERILKENALGRASDPDEVAGFILHVASMQNVSGQVFNLDSRIV